MNQQLLVFLQWQLPLHQQEHHQQKTKKKKKKKNYQQQQQVLPRLETLTDCLLRQSCEYCWARQK